MGAIDFKLQLFGNISNYTANSLVSGTSDDDRIDNYGDNVTIMGLAGNDIIWNRGSTVSVDGGDDDDLICAEQDTNNVTLNGGKGNDSVLIN